MPPDQRHRQGGFFNPPWAIDPYWAGRPRSDNWQRLKQSTLREIGRFSVQL
jgi:hypothetical protein